MSPQFVDFDADGHTDIVTATWQGSAWLVRGSDKGWHAPQHITDKAGKAIIVGYYYDKKTQYTRIANDPHAALSRQEVHCIGAYAIDWDADGDLDLLLSTKGGAMFLRVNEGKAGAPAFSTENKRVAAGGAPFSHKAGVTATRVVDWDGDGLFDVVFGSFRGGVYWCRNGGEKGKPALEAPKQLVANGKNTDQPLQPTSGSYVDVVDYDGDGDLDLLVGAYANFSPKAPVLTDAQKARLVAINKEIGALSRERSKLFTELNKSLKGLTPAEQNQKRRALYSTPAYRALATRTSELYRERSKLSPPPGRQSGLWLYTRN